MLGPLGGLEKLRHVAVVEPRPLTERTGPHDVGCDLRGGRPSREPFAYGLVDDLLETLARAPHFAAQLRGDLVVESECRSHIEMLAAEHRDVQPLPEVPGSRFPSCSP